MTKWGKWGATARAGQVSKIIKPAEVEKIAKRGRVGAKVIGIISGKGGVGKTTLTSNLGVIAASQTDWETLAIDANVLTSNLGLHLGIVHPQIVLQDIINKAVSLDRAVYVHPSNLRVIPASVELGGTLSAKHLKESLDNLSTQYDYIFVDSAPGLAVEALAVIEACDQLIVITNPEMPAITDAIKTIDVADKLKKRILGVVVNKVRGKEWEIGAKDIEMMCGYPIIGQIPYDDAVPESIANKTPVVLWNPGASASRAILEVAEQVCGRKLYAARENAEEQTSYLKPRRPGILRRLYYFLFG